MKISYIVILFSFFIVGCVEPNTSKKTALNIKELLLGDWELIKEDNDLNLILLNKPYGISFNQDSLEIFTGLYRFKYDSVLDYEKKIYQGNFVKYKIEKDSIFINRPDRNDWIFWNKFISCKSDTLILSNGNTIEKYTKLNYNTNKNTKIDQIIISYLGCWWHCAIMDILIDKSGNVTLNGEDNIKYEGYFSTKLDSKTTEFIFKKFNKADPLNLLDNYTSSFTDQQAISTTFIENGKIVKTIFDYGMLGTNELIWAYIPITHLIETNSFEKVSSEVIYTVPLFESFKKDSVELTLEKSESFFLWTELLKAKQIEMNAISNLTLDIELNIRLLPILNDEKTFNSTIKYIHTNGQIFKAEFWSGKIIIFDLGYDFLKMNFTESEFF